MPAVSIILPTYKKPPHLAKAIESVLAQSFTDWELVIVDDGLDKDILLDLQKLVKNDSRIIIISNPSNLGIQKSLNTGLAVAKGEYIARIDDDDQWIDIDKIKKQVEFMELNRSYVLVGTDAMVCDENFNNLPPYSMPKSDLEIRNRILFKNCFLHSTVLIKKTTLDLIGRYSDKKDVRHVEDYDLWLRLGQLGKFLNLDSKSVKLMIRGDSITSKNRLIQARKDIILTIRYHKHYPYFFFALLLSCCRLVFFYLNKVVVLPPKVMHKIQALYKAI